MKDGRTHLAHKVEHAVDMETGAIVAVTLHGADVGDTQTIPDTVAEAGERITSVAADTDSDEVAQQVSAEGPREVVTDKGYHSRQVVSALSEWGLRTYCSEPNRRRQRWRDRRLQGRHRQEQAGCSAARCPLLRSLRDTMMRTYTMRKSKRYRYYVCYNAQQQGWKNCETKS